MLKIGVFGALLRLFSQLLENLKEVPDMSLSAVFVRNNLDFAIDPSVLVTSDMKPFLQASDIIIDFSLPDACEELLEASIASPKPLVILSRHCEDEQYVPAQ